MKDDRTKALIRAFVELEREHYYLKQSDLADELGVSVASITRWKKTGIPLDFWLKLADIAAAKGSYKLAEAFLEPFRARYERFFAVVPMKLSAEEDHYVKLLVDFMRRVKGWHREGLLSTLRAYEKELREKIPDWNSGPA